MWGNITDLTVLAESQRPVCGAQALAPRIMLPSGLRNIHLERSRGVRKVTTGMTGLWQPVCSHGCLRAVFMQESASVGNCFTYFWPANIIFLHFSAEIIYLFVGPAPNQNFSPKTKIPARNIYKYF